MKLTIKQTISLDYLEDKTTTELLYGGAAGGGKSALGCYWQMKKRLKFPKTRSIMGRSELKALKQTTLNTFFQIADMQGIKPNIHFVYQQQAGVIQFYNGSEILLKDLFYYPSDPYFTSLGSLEVTDVFIDEGGEVSDQAYNIVNSRIRYRLTDFCECGNEEKKRIISKHKNGQPKRWICGNGHKTEGLIPKCMITCNPSKNFLYSKFYKPSRDGELPEHRKFVQVLPIENPYLPQAYIDQLSRLDPITKQRLLGGNWEYEDSMNQLMTYDNILNIFSNYLAPSGNRYITADIARFGSDKTVIVLWNGWRGKIHTFQGLRTTEVAERIEKLMKEHNVPLSNVIVDEDGVGGGVVDALLCKGFVNNSSAIKTGRNNDNYANLKTQCYFFLSEVVNRGHLYIDEPNPTLRSTIISEMEMVRVDDIDREGSKRIMSKAEVKELLGHSPDYADALMLRAWFDIRPMLSSI